MPFTCSSLSSKARIKRTKNNIEPSRRYNQQLFAHWLQGSLITFGCFLRKRRVILTHFNLLQALLVGLLSGKGYYVNLLAGVETGQEQPRCFIWEVLPRITQVFRSNNIKDSLSGSINQWENHAQRINIHNEILLAPLIEVKLVLFIRLLFLVYAELRTAPISLLT